MSKKISTTILSLFLILLLTQGMQAQLCKPASFYNGLCTTWEYYGPCSSTYNCLAYAKGITNKWVWPWGSGNPSSSQVDSYMTSSGYLLSGSTARIISYGRSNYSIGHFSKVVNSSTCLAKCGQLNILKHNSWDPYTDTYYYGGYNIAYGDKRKVYYQGLRAYINGPRKGTNSGTYTWCARPSGGQAPYTYQWQHKYLNYGYSNCGTSQCHVAPLPMDASLSLKVTVTDSNGRTYTSTTHVLNLSTIGKPDPYKRVSVTESQLKNHIAELEFILAGNTFTANPYHYINNDAFRKIVTMGPKAISCIRNTIALSAKEGLIEYILAIAAEKIASVNLKEESDRWESAVEWIFSWDTFLNELPEKVDAIINSQDSEEAKNRSLEALGFAALPVLEDKIKKGAVELQTPFNSLIEKYNRSNVDSKGRKAAASADEMIKIYRGLIKSK